MLITIAAVLLTIAALYGIMTFLRSVKAAIEKIYINIEKTYKSVKCGLQERRSTIRDVTVRSVGLQSQTHYSWHEAEPRFKSKENGFRRSGEVTIG